MPDHPIIEFRRYKLKPHCRDTLIDLFERHFVEGQEAEGIQILGQFYDLDDRDRFIWLRSFDDHAARVKSLNGFYYGPIWTAYRDQANATMLAADDVLMLRPTTRTSNFVVDGVRHSNREPRSDSEGLVVASVIYVDSAPSDTVVADVVREIVLPAMTRVGGRVLASFVTDPSENGFPILPVRDELAVVWFGGLKSAREYKNLGAEGVTRQVAEALNARYDTETLRLLPTQHSRVTPETPPCYSTT